MTLRSCLTIHFRYRFSHDKTPEFPASEKIAKFRRSLRVGVLRRLSFYFVSYSI